MNSKIREEQWPNGVIIYVLQNCDLINYMKSKIEKRICIGSINSPLLFYLMSHNTLRVNDLRYVLPSPFFSSRKNHTIDRI